MLRRPIGAMTLEGKKNSRQFASKPRPSPLFSPSFLYLGVLALSHGSLVKVPDVMWLDVFLIDQGRNLQRGEGSREGLNPFPLLPLQKKVT
jgi:hypothetical protein